MQARIASLSLPLIALTLAGCPPTSECPSGEVWNGTSCVAPYDVGPDTHGDGGEGDGGTDVPCGGCSSGVCDLTTGDCEACLDGDASTCEDDQNACVGNQCVACDSPDDCPLLTAPECSSTNECVLCTGNEACEDRVGTTVCDLVGGACVECASNADCTGTNEGCDFETNTCETYVPGSAVTCGPCIADAQCMDGQVCAPTEFPVGSGTDVGNFCLWRIDAVPGPNGDCINTPPYRRTDSVMTVDDLSVDVCSPQVSTCTALADAGGPTCTMRGAADAACGIADLEDGFCPATGSALCTVTCTTFRDCPCTDETCARQYECASNRCGLSRSCDTTTGTCG